MKHDRPSQQNTAGIIRYSCGILFMLFSFFYLFCLQGEILAEAEYVYSKGLNRYHLLMGAIIITAILQLVQWAVSKLSQLPANRHALSYIPSALLLAILTDIDRDTIQHFSFGPWVWIAPLIIIMYVALVIVVRTIHSSSDDAVTSVKSQIFPDFIIMFALMLIVGWIPTSTDVYHYELKAERLIMEKDYEGAARVGETSLRTSARLTQLRMYALSKMNQLPERIFEYPQYDGSKGLLDVTDTIPTYRFSPQNICFHLGALCGPSVHSTDRFYNLVLNDSIWNQHTVDYYLCSLLLDKKLNTFCKKLEQYYLQNDSIDGENAQLPKAYKEALLLIGEPAAAAKGLIVVHHDSLTTVTDQEVIKRFNAYKELKNEWPNQIERINKTHREFGDTYWWYYDFSHLAKGELQQR